MIAATISVRFTAALAVAAYPDTARDPGAAAVKVASAVSTASSASSSSAASAARKRCSSRSCAPGAAGAFWSSISHDDAASAVVAAVGVRPGIYNVTDDEPLTRRA